MVDRRPSIDRPYNIEEGRATSQPIRALATIALDVQAFEQLGLEALDRLAELVEARMSERHRGPAKRLLSVGEVAELTGLSRSLIYREIERGHLAAYRVGSRVRMDPTAVASWKEQCRLRPRDQALEYEPVARPSAPPPRAAARRSSTRSRTTGGERCEDPAAARWPLPDPLVRRRPRLPKRQRTFARKKDAERFAREVERREELGELALFDQARARWPSWRSSGGAATSCRTSWSGRAAAIARC